MPRLSLFVFALCCLSLNVHAAEPAKPAAPKTADHAIVSGFDRFFASPESSAVDGGLMLLGELNCTSCHAPDKSLGELIQRKQAPYLGEITHRADPKFLAKFIASTHTVKPGSTMPSLFAELPPVEATAKATALAHYLLSLGKQPFTRVAPELSAVTRGETLFHNAGCVACHAPRLERAAKANDDEDDDSVVDLNATSIPLSRKLHEKYSVSGLSSFLLNPLTHRPSGRMPNLNLKPEEAADIAQYLLKDTIAPAPLTMAMYEGQWKTMPDFSKLKPKTTGPATGFSIAGFKNRDNFAVVFDGFIRIEKAGEYVFFVVSDDGAQILIDGQIVTNNDGVHPAQESKGKVQLDPGLHAIRVAYFEGGSDEVLQVTWQTKGMPRQPIPNSVLTSTDKPLPNEDEWKLDPALAKQGAELFVSIGCANCHQLDPKQKALAGKSYKSLNALAGEGGCLSNKPAAGHPYYQLSAAQVTALTRALQVVKANAVPKRTPADAIHVRLATLNCYACHKRGDLGGVIRERDPYFTANQPDLGDEGRLPPILTGVGDKLLPAFFTSVLTKAVVSRPYMDARMPQFGAGNLGPLAVQLTQEDLRDTPLPKVETTKTAKADGQKLVGKEGLSCVSCHMFNRNRSLGIQAMDLTIMSERLRPEWFHKYMHDPSAFRPGTRMPQAFVNGKSTLTKVLDGNADKQIHAIWEYLADGRKAKNPIGVIPQGMELIVGGEALIYRNFITGAGPRAIGVGYPEDVNLAFDANHQRLALVWQGKFIDGAKHWEGRGQGYQPPLGDRVVKLPDGPALATLASPDEAWPKGVDANSKDPNFRFHGYELDDKRRPTFLYEYFAPKDNKITVRDYPIGEGTLGEQRIVRTLSFTSLAPTDKLYFRVAAGKIEPVAGGYRINGELTCSFKGNSKPLVRGTDGKNELLLPIALEANKPLDFQIEYRW